MEVVPFSRTVRPPEMAATLHRLWNRLDTLSAAGLSGRFHSSSNSSDYRQIPRRAVFAATSLGLLGHSGLLMLSVLCVTLAQRLWFPPDPNVPKPAGILNRCPWPFIFFHDIRQGFKDPPTWMVVTYLVLWRLVKVVQSSRAAVV